MAVGNMFMGTGSGKIGNMVLYRSGGEQRMRVYLESIKNPRSQTQMNQRVQLANLVAFYRIAQPFLVGSFQIKDIKLSSYNSFVKANLGNVKVFLTKTLAAQNACVAAPYRISDGDIPSIGVTGAGVASVTNLALGAGLVIDDNTTVGTVSAALLALNANVKAGMQLNYLSLLQGINPVTKSPYLSYNFYSFVIDTTSTDNFREKMPSYAFSNVNGFVGHGDSIGDGGFAWVLSKKDATGAVTASSQNLILTNQALFEQYSSESARQKASESYGPISEQLLDPGTVAVTSSTAGSSESVLALNSVKKDGVALVAGSDAKLMSGNYELSGSSLDVATMKAVCQPSDSTTNTTEYAMDAVFDIVSSGSKLIKLTAKSTVSTYRLCGFKQDGISLVSYKPYTDDMGGA